MTLDEELLKLVDELPYIPCDNAFSYRIPDEIKDKISGKFMKELILQIRLVFPDIQDDEIDYITGTCGWNDALNAACSECGYDWLANYADELDWHDWDIFSYELTEMALGL